MTGNLAVSGQGVFFVSGLDGAVMVQNQRDTIAIAAVGDDADMRGINDDVATLPGSKVGEIGGERQEVTLEIGE